MVIILKLLTCTQLVVIASIHQPSTSTFRLFDKLALLAKGKTCYFGPLEEASRYFDTVGYPLPAETNPAEFYLDLINTDLVRQGEDVNARIHVSMKLQPVYY